MVGLKIRMAISLQNSFMLVRMMIVLDNHIENWGERSADPFFPNKWNIKQFMAQSGALALEQVVKLPSFFIYFWF